MTEPTEAQLSGLIGRYGQKQQEMQRLLLSNPSAEEQKLLEDLHAVGAPITQFQEEWFNETFRGLSREFRSAAISHAKETLGTGKPDTELDRFQIATIRLIETVHGYFSGKHNVTLTDEARATCEVISGLMKTMQKSGLIPKDISRIYKSPKEISEIADEYTLLSADLHRQSRADSNASKHADRDAMRLIAKPHTTNLQHLMYSMVNDYASLHCALLEAGLLSTELERLYPTERSTLIANGRGNYHKIYDPYDTEVYSDDIEALADMSSLFIDAANQFDTREVHVPAATLACLLFSKDGLHATHSPEIRRTTLETFENLRVWPILVSTNARIVRDPNILDLEEKAEPRPQ